jgi:hypothetical protein
LEARSKNQQATANNQQPATSKGVVGYRKHESTIHGKPKGRANGIQKRLLPQMI